MVYLTKLVEVKSIFRLLKITIFRFGPLGLLLIFSIVQFFLLLRHKSPWVNDTWFYQHIYYRFQGLEEIQAYRRVLTYVDLPKQDEITKNIFGNQDQYFYSLRFFTKRPVYPFLAYVTNKIVRNEYLSFMLPVFIAYCVVIIEIFWLACRGLGKFWGALITALFISFYPFLDLSTYFMTDTIGAAFWLMQIGFLYKFLRTGAWRWLIIYALVLAVSLFNREQGVLMVFTSLFLWIYLRTQGYSKKIKQGAWFTLLLTLVIVGGQIAAFTVTRQKNLYDTLVYTQNRYGLLSQDQLPRETFLFWLKALRATHIGLMTDLLRHRWWLTITFLGVVGIIKWSVSAVQRKVDVLNLLLVSSTIASYLGLIAYPVLSYRYIYPTVVGLIYFAVQLIKDFYAIKHEEFV